jgi:CHASE2 domain-containing sensor protein
VFCTIFIYVALYLFTLIPVKSDFLNPIEDIFNDFEWTDIAFSKFHEQQPADTNITLVNIGILPRAEIAKMIFILNQYEPKVIGIDAFFRRLKPDYPGADSAILAYHDSTGQWNPTLAHGSDSLLMAAFANTQNLVLVSELEIWDSVQGQYRDLKTSHPAFTQFSKTGFANMKLTQGAKENEDFRVAREFKSVEKVHDSINYCFPLKLAEIYNKSSKKRLLDRGSEYEIINYRGNIYGENRVYTAIDYNDLLEGNFDPSIIKGKIILLGFMGQDRVDLTSKVWGEDKFFTPLNSKYIGKAYPDMYGVVVHANVISSILYGNFINFNPEWLDFCIGIFFAFINVVLFYYIKRNHDALFDVSTKVIQLAEFLMITFLIDVYIFSKFNYKINISVGIVAMILSAELLEVYLGAAKPLVFKLLYALKLPIPYGGEPEEKHSH